MRRVTGSVLLIGLFASSVLALYYRHQADEFRERLAAINEPARQVRESLRTEPKDKRALIVNPAANQAGHGVPDRAVLQAVAERENRIRQLEANLQNKDALILSLQQAATNQPADPSRRLRHQQSWLDELKQSNPQRYAAFTNRREQVQQAVQMSVAEKAAYFSDLDPSTLSEEDLANYQVTAQLLDETWRLTELLRTDLSADDRRTAMQALHQDRHDLGPLLESARSKEFINLGLQLGYNGDDAQAFGEYIGKVIDLTSIQSIYRKMRTGAQASS